MPPQNEQDRQLARVSSRIERAVWAYVDAVPMGGRFLGHELDRWVCGQACATPGSATRILRNLRAKGVINYRVSNRAKAEYERLEVEQPGQMDLFGEAS